MNSKKKIGKVSTKTKMLRAIWNVAFLLLFRPFATRLFWPWRWCLLKMFGADVSFKANVYSSVKIWAPWNLKMDKGSCLGPHVICYNQAIVEFRENATVSQYAYLCTAGHSTDEILNADSGLIISPISLGKNSWVGTRAFVNLGVNIGEAAIVGATASVYKDVEPYTVVGGNPAKIIKKRDCINK